MRSLVSLLIRTLLLSYKDHTLKTSFNSMTVLEALSPNIVTLGGLYIQILYVIYTNIQIWRLALNGSSLNLGTHTWKKMISIAVC